MSEPHRFGQSDLVSDTADDHVTTRLGEVAVERASPGDAPAILQLRDALATWMVQHGISQWRPGEMPLAWIEVCIAQGWVFAASRDGNLVASVTLVWTDPLVWGNQSDPAGYIHMLMVDRAHAGLGLGRSLLDWAERRIARSGRHRARLDCVRANEPLRRYYENTGYAFVGYREFDERIPSTALYEKTLIA